MMSESRRRHLLAGSDLGKVVIAEEDGPTTPSISPQRREQLRLTELGRRVLSEHDDARRRVV